MHITMDLHLYFYSSNPICRIFSKNSPSLISCFTFIHFSFALMWNRNDGYLKIQAPLISIYISNILKVLQPGFTFNSLMLFFWMRLMFWRNVKFVHVCMHVCVWGVLFKYFRLYLEGHFLLESYFTWLSLFALPPLFPPEVLGMEPRMLCMTDKHSPTGLCLQLWCSSLKLRGFPFIPLYTRERFSLSTRLPNTHFLPHHCTASLSLLSSA